MNTQLTVQAARDNTPEAAGDITTTSWRADLGGASASVADVLSAEDVESLPPGYGMLVVTRGPNTGSQIRLDRAVMSAGRHQLSDIYLDDITVSRRHAEFRREKGEFHIVDCGSFNSSYVNGQPVESAVLSNGDEIQIGKYRLVFIRSS